MDFSLTTLFVAPSGTLASAGSTQDLTPGQLGLFTPTYAVATAGTIAAQKYFYIAQGRQFPQPTLGSKRSDRIKASNVVEWYKVTAEDTAANEIWTVNNFSVQCDDVIHLQINAHSNLIDTIAFNGMTKVVSAAAPCCDCGELPCEDVDAASIQAIVDKLVSQINTPAESTDGSAQFILSTFFTAVRTGSGATSGISIQSKPLATYSNAFLPFAYPYESDRIWFKVVVFKAPDSSVDLYVNDVCEQVADARVTQRSTYRTGTSDEVALLQRHYHSYHSQHKQLFLDGGYNQAFEDFVVPGTFYDMYYLKFTPIEEGSGNWTPQVLQDEAVIVYFPTGTGTAFETALTAALGAPKDQSGENITTTTTTSTSTTTTTTTTFLLP